MSKELIKRLRSTTYHNLDPYEAADRIEQLEAEVERLATKVVKQKKELDDFDNVIDDMSIAVSCINPLEDLKRAIANIKEKLAASQAREQQLREALVACVCAMQDYQAGIGITELFDKGERLGRLVLLSEKQDTTALEAMIQKAGEVMRERTTNNIANTDWLFANASDQKAARYNISYQARALQAKNIRALPGVKLDDLKGGAA